MTEENRLSRLSWRQRRLLRRVSKRTQKRMSRGKTVDLLDYMMILCSNNVPPEQIREFYKQTMAEYVKKTERGDRVGQLRVDDDEVLAEIMKEGEASK